MSKQFLSFSIEDRGPSLWRKAKKIIPGGGMLLSKRSEMFLPDLWPAYYSAARGISVTDIDGRTFQDFYMMGVGTNSLGYSRKEVDRAVIRQVRRGNMSSLNNPGEPDLADKLISMHPWAEMARFTRTGGEAMAVAVRIARAATGRDHVAVCGYHGWHDWYLSLNLENPEGLDTLLLPGLEPLGVPSQLRSTNHAFTYGDIESFQALIDQHELAAVVMEVARGAAPDVEFLSQVRERCSRKGIVLIFDECSTGFRESFGGLHMNTGVEPDMLMLGKALGNGYAANAVLGTAAVMDSAQRTFISSTFWTEGIGTTAALKTLEIMSSTRSWEMISQIGMQVKQIWLQVADQTGVPISVGGLDALATFRFKDERHNIFKTFLTQEMLKRGYLAGTSFYPSTAHSPARIARYAESLMEVFGAIAAGWEDTDFEKKLSGPEAHQTFRRLSN